MTEGPDHHRRLRAAFEAALLQAPSLRERCLDEICAGDVSLRHHVARLLAAHAAAPSFLEHPPVNVDPVTDDFTGTARFEILRRLGVGGMGVVYEARDRDRDEIVALKTLLRADAGDLYWLKREFRSLADVAHVNLVCLYELVVDDGAAFFTMELVRGVTFVDYVRAAGTADVERLLSAFCQLVDGVSALHRAGKLHRDIKPSNVLVTADGRVVILDFGLIADLDPRRGNGDDRVTGGTPAYMSPEEITGADPSEASDWYGVGVTLYEALTGQLPFAGSWPDVFARKRSTDPRPPRELAADVPARWDAICTDLLARDPAQRLSGADALRHLRGGAQNDDGRPPSRRESSFVGRSRELETLTAALQLVRGGHAVTVQITGASGIGKSALLHHFLHRAATPGVNPSSTATGSGGVRPGSDPIQFLGRAAGEASSAVVVFSGRCYERESVPYKALDGVVDSVSRYLTSLPRATADALVPPDTAALSRLFPVLLQAPAVVDVARRTTTVIADPAVLRSRAIAALRELLTRIAASQPAIVCIDDLQWADADSAVVLEELLRPPGPPGLLTLLCARSETTTATGQARLLLDPTRGETIALTLEPLSERDAAELVGTLAHAESVTDAADAGAIVRQAEGNPFLLEQLARYVAGHRHATDQRPTFADVFSAQLRGLPHDARRFVETLALCGRPMAVDIVADAADVAGDHRPLISLLRAGHFIRSSSAAPQSARIEAYHDRIREALVASLSPEAMRRTHARLAQTLVAQAVDDPEALFAHYHGSGDRDAAARQAGAAAGKAHAALAFDRAAWYYRQALDLVDGAAPMAWRADLATALANAGRPADAADAYLEAGAAASAAQRIELRRRGAEQLLIGGHIDRGLDVLGSVLDDVGMHLARGPRAALGSVLWRRAQLRWRGLAFTARQAEDLPADVLLRIDTCWSVTAGLATVDMVRASQFSARHLLLALDAGEPYRIARGLALEAAFSSIGGGGHESRAAALFARAREVCDTVGHPHTAGILALTTGMAALAIGHWAVAAERCEQALSIFRDQCTGVTWELNGAQNFLLGALLYQGQLRDVAARVPPLLSDASSRGNRFVATELCTRMNLAWLASDRPDEGERLAIESIARWSQQGFHRQHYSAMLARVQTNLYRGQAEAAWRLLDDSWRPLRRTLLMRAQLVRVEAWYLRGRCALAMAAEGHARARFLSIADEAARRIAAQHMPWSDPIARLVEAASAHLQGDVAHSGRCLADAVDGFDRAGMQLYAAAARSRLAAALGGDRGRTLRQQSEAWMAAQHVAHPAGMIRMLAPALPSS